MHKHKEMKVITFWETPSTGVIPPYVLLGIATMQSVFKEKFLLLTKHNVDEHLDISTKAKKWAFRKKNEHLTDEVASVVAKSDFIRMRYVYSNGGFWLDADTVVLNDITQNITFEDDVLYWHSEAVFGACAKNPILKSASDTMLDSDFQEWGNPGGIKNVIKQPKVEDIPFKYLDPGVRPVYSFGNSEIVLRKDVDVSDFLTNKDVSVLKLYNTGFSKSEPSRQRITSFLTSDTLLAKIFLTINPDIEFWSRKAAAVENELA